MNEIAYGMGETTDEKVIFSFSTEGMHRPITNGDIIKAVFSVETIDDFCHSFGVRLNNSNYIQFNKDWWNAPYRREENVKND